MNRLARSWINRQHTVVLWMIITTMLLLVVSVTALATSPVVSVYEEQLIDSVRDLLKGRHAQAEEQIRVLLERHQSSRLGHLIYADLLAAQAGLEDRIDAYASTQDLEIVAKLREQLRTRWDYFQNQKPDRLGRVPGRLLYAGSPDHQVIYIDLPASRLYVFVYRNDRPLVAQDYYVSIGLQGIGKQREGDRRTPIGIYRTTGYIPGQNLHERYGSGALPISYPNFLDKSHQRTGYGIWLHGTEPGWVNRAPLATDGCVSLSNNDFETLNQLLGQHGQTPVVIDDKPEWITLTTLNKRRKELLSVLAQWKQAWESGDETALSAFYAQPAIQAAANSWPGSSRILPAHTEIYSYPGEVGHLLTVVRIQPEHGQEQTFEQYWKKLPDSRWKIVSQTALD